MTERRHADPAELVRDVKGHWDEARVERALDRHLRARRRRRGLQATGALLVASAAAAFLLWPRAPEPLASMSEHVAPDPLALEDGSRLSPVGESIVTMHERTATRVRAELVSGAVDVDIVPNPERRVVIEAGDVTVTVLGTAFRVTRVESEVEVEVTRGRVAVDWIVDEVAHRDLLTAGEHGIYPRVEAPEIEATPEAIEVTARRRDEARDEENVPNEADVPDEGADEAHVVTGSAWRALASHGDFDAAYDALEGQTVDALDDLLLAADAARLSGHPREALPYLARAEASAGSDPRGTLAAFSAGRILAQLGRSDEAAETFERVLALEPSGSLAEDALVRAAEAHHRAGHDAAARALAERYVSAHPEGRWAERMRTLSIP